jgi:NADP-dependent 3-hydroxy acid dehydrogenase YdfG
MIQADLSDQVTVVTGASAGMGAAIARRFAASGSRVVLAGRRRERLDKLAAEINEAGGSALPVQCDVTDWSQVESLVGRALAQYGQVDVMVNNAGAGRLKPFSETSVEEIESQIDVNFKGLCYGCKAVLDHMLARRSGHIINIGSVGSVRHYPSFAVYVGAKHAVLGFSRSLYEEVREMGIRVNVLCPAAVNTEFLDVAGFQEVPWPEDGMIQPEDIAELALTCVALPGNIQIDTMVIWPTCQAT